MIDVSRRTRGEFVVSGRASPDVLIVSRDYDTRTIFAAVLRNAGFAVRELADPDQVVAAARGCAIVITDFPTTTASGNNVTSLLRGDPLTNEVTILNASTHVLDDELAEAHAAGVDATLVLPAFPERLVECVRQLLTKKSGPPPSER